MTAAIEPVLFLAASVLLGAVVLLMVFGMLLWRSYRQQAQDESKGRIWEHDPSDIDIQDGNSIVAPGK
jgi:hypothetical protein